MISVKDRYALTARVAVGGTLSSHKGINLPGVRLRISGFTEKDEADLAFGISQGIDAVAISFVRTAEDVKKVRYAMERFSKEKRMPLLIAKLEKPEALDNLDRNRGFLKKGGVFSDDFIDSWLELKMQEVYAFEHTPHPVEFKMYYSV